MESRGVITFIACARGRAPFAKCIETRCGRNDANRKAALAAFRRSDHRHGKFSRARYARRYRKNNARARNFVISARASDREFGLRDWRSHRIDLVRGLNSLTRFSVNPRRPEICEGTRRERGGSGASRCVATIDRPIAGIISHLVSPSQDALGHRSAAVSFRARRGRLRVISARSTKQAVVALEALSRDRLSSVVVLFRGDPGSQQDR